MWWPRLAGTLPGGARPTKAGPVPQQLPAPFGAGPKGSVRAHRTQRTPALSGFSECPAQVVDVPTTFDGPGGPIVLRVDAMVGRDGDSFLSAPYTIFDCHETGGGNRPRAFGWGRSCVRRERLADCDADDADLGIVPLAAQPRGADDDNDDDDELEEQEYVGVESLMEELDDLAVAASRPAGGAAVGPSTGNAG